MSITIHVTANGEERRFAVPPAETGHTLADILARQGLPLNTRCGQKGLCEGCRAELRQGRLLERAAVREAPGEFLTCLAHPLPGEDLSLHLPARSLLAHRPCVQEAFRIRIPCAHDPLVAPGTDGRHFGLAIDIGTTTVVVLLVDLRDGAIRGRAGDFNRQMHLGDDVLTRIQLCTETAKIGQLQEAIGRETLAPLVRQCLEQAGLRPDQVTAVAAAGNTVMLHLLCGIDPTPMGRVPFQPHFLAHQVLPPSAILLPELDGAEVHLLPGLAAYVGADLAAGIYSTGLHFEDGPSLLLDVGTNGEIILKAAGRVLGCATAAGPAFEGAGLAHGMRAVDNAISHLGLSREPFAIQAERVGGSPKAPLLGLCGSAYVDFLAEGRRCGLLEASGRFADDFYQALPPAHRTEAEYGRALRLFPDSPSQHLTVTEADLAQLLQAKGAIAAGLLSLLRKVGLAPAEVRTLYLAGGFGFHLDVPNAIAAGLLPGFRPEQVEVVGNTSLAGAYLALLDRHSLTEMEKIRAAAEIVELNLEPGFEDTYIDQLSLP